MMVSDIRTPPSLWNAESEPKTRSVEVGTAWFLVKTTQTKTDQRQSPCPL